MDWICDEFQKQEGIDLRNDKQAMQRVKEAAENVLERIDLMKKAILAKAFRGELTR